MFPPYLKNAILAAVVLGVTSHGLAVVRIPATKTYDLAMLNSLNLGSCSPNLKHHNIIVINFHARIWF